MKQTEIKNSGSISTMSIFIIAVVVFMMICWAIFSGTILEGVLIYAIIAILNTVCMTEVCQGETELDLILSDKTWKRRLLAIPPVTFILFMTFIIIMLIHVVKEFVNEFVKYLKN